MLSPISRLHLDRSRSLRRPVDLRDEFARWLRDHGRRVESREYGLASTLRTPTVRTRSLPSPASGSTFVRFARVDFNQAAPPWPRASSARSSNRFLRPRVGPPPASRGSTSPWTTLWRSRNLWPLPGTARRISTAVRQGSRPWSWARSAPGEVWCYTTNGRRWQTRNMPVPPIP